MRFSELSSDVCSSDLTLLVGGSGPMVFNPVTNKYLAYDSLTYFEPITILGSYPIVFTTPKSSSINTLSQLIEVAKSKPTELNYGSAGVSFQVPTEHRSEEHTSELQSLMRISYAVFCLKKKNKNITNKTNNEHVEHTQVSSTH